MAGSNSVRIYDSCELGDVLAPPTDTLGLQSIGCTARQGRRGGHSSAAGDCPTLSCAPLVGAVAGDECGINKWKDV